MTQRDTILPFSVAFGHTASRFGESRTCRAIRSALQATRTDPTRVLEEMKRQAVEQLGGVPSALYGPVARPLTRRAPRRPVKIRRGEQIALLDLRRATPARDALPAADRAGLR